MRGARTPEQARRSLVELSSLDKERVLICWLAAPKQERPLLMEFFRRHESSENFFAKRAHWEGNIWETELQLGFYQMVTHEDEDEFVPLEGSQAPLSNPKIPSLFATLQGHEVRRVAMSFRFVGDLRDRLWTCHFFCSATQGFQGLVDEYWKTAGSKEGIYEEKQCQRKLLELVYVERALSEVRRSIESILAAFEKELDESLDPQSESFEFIHDHSSRPLKATTLLGDVSQQLESSISAIEQWEKREDLRGLRSRWSLKDQERHGEKLRKLTPRCKFNVQQWRVQQSRLKEQRRAADQRHSDLVSYKQLQEARRSTCSAADVRLFTYVTIVFLPLSFSSSLFSMAGTPTGSTISVMAPTTAIALAITLLLLSNMNILDRNQRFWVNRINTHTRRKMTARGNDATRWSKISKELEEVTQHKLKAQDTEKRLPAESTWYHFLFWLYCAFKAPGTYVHEGVHAWQNHDAKDVPSNSNLHFIIKIVVAISFIPLCIVILVAQILVLYTIDILQLFWTMMQRQGRKVLGPLRKGQGSSVQDLALKWLESPPRPVREYINKLNAGTAEPPGANDSPIRERADTYSEEPTTPHHQDLITSLSARTASFTEKFQTNQKTSSKDSSTSTSKQGNESDVAIEHKAGIHSEASPTSTNALESSSQLANPNPLAEQPRRKRQFLAGRFRKPKINTDEAQMRVGWSV